MIHMNAAMLEFVGVISVDGGTVYIGEDLKSMLDFSISSSNTLYDTQIENKCIDQDIWYKSALKLSTGGDGEFRVYRVHMNNEERPVGYFIDCEGVYDDNFEQPVAQPMVVYSLEHDELYNIDTRGWVLADTSRNIIRELMKNEIDYDDNMTMNERIVGKDEFNDDIYLRVGVTIIDVFVKRKNKKGYMVVTQNTQYHKETYIEAHKDWMYRNGGN